MAMQLRKKIRAKDSAITMRFPQAPSAIGACSLENIGERVVSSRQVHINTAKLFVEGKQDKLYYRDEPQPKLSPAMIMGYCVSISPGMTSMQQLLSAQRLNPAR